MYLLCIDWDFCTFTLYPLNLSLKVILSHIYLLHILSFKKIVLLKSSCAILKVMKTDNFTVDQPFIQL
jgi:hypothetical protein